MRPLSWDFSWGSDSGFTSHVPIAASRFYFLMAGSYDIDIGPSGRVHSEAHAVSNTGTIVGEMGDIHVAIFDSSGEGNCIDLGQGYAWGVNDNQQIVGSRKDL